MNTTTTNLTQSKFSIVSVTPEMAEKWIKNTPPEAQRKLRSFKVTEYTKQMLAGTFRGDKSNDLIQIAPDGSIVNGQHRLNSVVKSGTTQQMKVEFDVSPDSFHYCDRGLKRSLSDDLVTDGLYSSNDAAKITPILNYIAKILHNSGAKNLNIDDARAFDRDYRNAIGWIRGMVASLNSSEQKSGLYQAAIMAAFAISHTAFPKETQQFFDRYSDLSKCTSKTELPYLLNTNFQEGMRGNKEPVRLCQAFKVLQSMEYFRNNTARVRVSSPTQVGARRKLLSKFVTPNF